MSLIRIHKLPVLLASASFAVIVAATAQAHPAPGIVVHKSGAIYFVIGPSHRIWKVDTDGQAVALVTGGLDQDFRVPHHLILDEKGQLYTASDAGSFIWRIAPDGTLTQIYPPDESQEHGSVGLGGDPFTITSDGRIIAVISSMQRKESRIVSITLDGSVTPLAGGQVGFADGEGEDARFGYLHGSSFAWSSDGQLYLTDDGRRVRRITPQGVVTTLAGGTERGTADGRGDEATFQYVTGLVTLPDGSIIVADSRARRIRRIGTDAMVTTIAGTGARGQKDGPGPQATFDQPVGLALDQEQNLYVLDYTRLGNHEAVRIRRIDADNVVTTYARIDNP